MSSALEFLALDVGMCVGGDGRRGCWRGLTGVPCSSIGTGREWTWVDASRQALALGQF
jgi:hypothetical protein